MNIWRKKKKKPMISVLNHKAMKRHRESRRHSTPVILPSITLTSDDSKNPLPSVLLPHIKDANNSNKFDESPEDKNVWEALRERIAENTGAKQLNSLMAQVRLKRRKQLRHMSADFSAGTSPTQHPGGILKSTPSSSNSYLNNFIHHSERRKSVSFCETESVKVFSIKSSKENEKDDESENFDESDEDQIKEPDQCRKQLIPTFVFPNKKPDFPSYVRKKVLVLEALDIQQNGCTDEDGISVIGIIRVNLSRLRALETEDQRKNGQQVIVGVAYSLDDWKTKMTSKSFKVPSAYIRRHPSLDDVNCVFMRFCIDCDELDVGTTLSMSLWCADKIASKSTIRFEDNNEGSYYKLKCTSKLNQWAAEAAKQLKNYAPIVRYNTKFYTKANV
ncbi:uncharacterized protein [Lepeophtheirus salmonis]|uniref:uncharacterized protein isoform X2 n=1 Tax=Lepeophtheirus salmonis TaxID=72036 RepID=UPI001AEA5655|nr:uncharacterized protein LOC121132496 isoform X2 [Lepeophtheirus salmonis]